MRTYAIGDIHGFRDQLAAVHRLIEADRARTGDHDAPVIHLGDLVDRGPDSAGVIEDIRAGMNAGKPWKVIKGNHDRMFSYFLQTPPRHDPGLRPDLDWLDPRLGGVETLQSFGVPSATRLDRMHQIALQRVPRDVIDWIDALPTYIERGPCVFVHAGIRPGVPMDRQSEDDLVWIRKGWLDNTDDHGVLVVHGHTALDRPTHFGNRIDLDSGAGYGRPLTAAVFEGRDCFILSEEGRRPLLP